jgi:hypothetical protein
MTEDKNKTGRPSPRPYARLTGPSRNGRPDLAPGWQPAARQRLDRETSKPEILPRTLPQDFVSVGIVLIDQRLIRSAPPVRRYGATARPAFFHCCHLVSDLGGARRASLLKTAEIAV